MYFWQVLRSGGTIGSDSVDWQVLGDPGSDLVEQMGTVIFNDGDISSNLDLKIRGDTAPEMDETFQVQLTAVLKVSR